MIVGNIHSALVAPHAGIYEALLDKAERENAELADRLSGLELRSTQQLAEMESELNNMQDQRDFCMGEIERLKCERDEALEKLSEWDDAAKHVEADHPDEVHCGCVPVLRKLLTDARKDGAELADRLSGLELRSTQELSKLERERDEARNIARWLDDYEAMEALLCEMQGLRDELVEVKRERDEARDDAKAADDHRRLTERYSKALRKERDDARKLAQWFYKRLKQVCIDNLLEESVNGILARLEEAVLDDPWLEEAAK